jgi:hypothetical protein
MRVRSLLLATVLCAVAFAALAPAAAAQGGFVPVTPQSFNAGGTTGTLTAIKITNVGVVNGQLVGSGLAAVNMANGTTAIGVFQNQPLAASTVATSKTCPILHLVIGPIKLNLLGLVVTVPNPIVLDITAVSGPGNLLGNLLCAVANLLNQSPIQLSQVSGLLTQIFALL